MADLVCQKCGALNVPDAVSPESRIFICEQCGEPSLNVTHESEIFVRRLPFLSPWFAFVLFLIAAFGAMVGAIAFPFALFAGFASGDFSLATALFNATMLGGAMLALLDIRRAICRR